MYCCLMEKFGKKKKVLVMDSFVSYHIFTSFSIPHV